MLNPINPNWVKNLSEPVKFVTPEHLGVISNTDFRFCGTIRLYDNRQFNTPKYCQNYQVDSEIITIEYTINDFAATCVALQANNHKLAEENDNLIAENESLKFRLSRYERL